MYLYLKYTKDESILSPMLEIIECFSEEYSFEISGKIVESYKKRGSPEKLFNYGDQYSFYQIKKTLHDENPYIIFTDIKIYDSKGNLEYTVSLYDSIFIHIYSRNNSFDRFSKLKEGINFVYKMESE